VKKKKRKMVMMHRAQYFLSKGREKVKGAYRHQILQCCLA
jgi:hypothetical protein